MSKNKVGQVLLMSLVTALMTTGCASFAGKQLPIYTTDQVPALKKKISASYDVKALAPHDENAIASPKLDEKVQKVLSASLLFAELKSGSGEGEYHCSFVFRNEGMPSEPIAFLEGFISGLTLTIIPAYARDIFIMTVDVKQADQVLKTYTYEDHIDSWIQLFLVFLAPFNWPPSVINSTTENMIMNFAYDFATDLQSGVYLARTIDQ